MNGSDLVYRGEVDESAADEGTVLEEHDRGGSYGQDLQNREGKGAFADIADLAIGRVNGCPASETEEVHIADRAAAGARFDQRVAWRLSVI